MSATTGVKKRLRIAVLTILKTLGVFALARWLTRRRVRILGYHGIWLGDERWGGDGLFMAPATFRSRMDLLDRLDYPVVSLDAALAGIAGEVQLPPCPVVITIDDGWRGTFTEMWPVLQAHGFPATLYVDTAHVLDGGIIRHVLERYARRIGGGDYCARTGTFEYMSPEQLRDLWTQGLDVQLHTHSHTVGDYEPDTVRREVLLNREALAGITGGQPTDFRHFSYPSGRYTPALGSILRSVGVVSAVTTDRGLADTRYMYLPRFLDAPKVTDIEFEAELAGVIDLLKRISRLGRSSGPVDRPGPMVRTRTTAVHA